MWSNPPDLDRTSVTKANWQQSFSRAAYNGNAPSTYWPATLAFNSRVATVPDLHLRSIAVCIQALQDAISYFDLLCQSPTVNPDDHEESKDMYEVELARLSKIYEAEEKKGNAT